MRTARRADEPVNSTGSSVAELFRDGLLDHRADRLEQAEAAYRQVLTMCPAHADALHLLGIIALHMGRNDLAFDYIGRAIALHGTHQDGYSNLGHALRDFGLVRPDLSDAHNNFGHLLYARGQPVEAEANCREALRLRPGTPEAHNNLGYALHALGRTSEAEACYRGALQLLPEYPEAHNNLATALIALGRPVEAEASCREALRLRPDVPEAHFTLAYALLLGGRLDAGWKEYEWRWQTTQLSERARNFLAPLWGGEAIGDRAILLHAEQGFGDTLQFCRYVPLIARGARIILEVQDPLVRLLYRLPGNIEVVAHGDRLPRFDLHCPLLSLPRAFGTTLDTIPAATPYLVADPALAANWHQRLAGLGGQRIGLVWAGSRRLNRPE